LSSGHIDCLIFSNCLKICFFRASVIWVCLSNRLKRPLWLIRKYTRTSGLIKTFTFHFICFSTCMVLPITLISLWVSSWRNVSKDIHETLIIIRLELVGHRCSHYILIYLLFFAIFSVLTVLVVFYLNILHKLSATNFSISFGCLTSKIKFLRIKSLNLRLICTYNSWLVSCSCIKSIIRRRGARLKI
jgi:hypothetical protein